MKYQFISIDKDGLIFKHENLSKQLIEELFECSNFTVIDLEKLETLVSYNNKIIRTPIRENLFLDLTNSKIFNPIDQ